MSLGEDARIEGFYANLEWNGKACIGADGTTTQMLVADAESLDPNFELGTDLREYVTMDCLRPMPGWEIESPVQVEDGGSVRLVKRLDNPSNPFGRFYAMKIVPGVDT